MVLAPKDTIQLAYAVEHLETACQSFIELHGVGPFFLAELKDLDVIYRGRPEKESLRFALGYRGSIQYELIETRFPFYEEVRAGRAIAFHHIKRVTETFDDDLARFRQSGSPAILDVPGSGITYIDTLKALGHYIELIDHTRNPTIAERAEPLRMASVGWNGENPLRTFELPRNFL